jgi:hypothetical protein
MQLQLCHGIQASFLKHSNVQNTGHIKKKKKKRKIGFGQAPMAWHLISTKAQDTKFQPGKREKVCLLEER